MERPYNTRIPILRADEYCLYYRTPYPGKQQGGELLWAHNARSDDCRSFENMVVVEHLSSLEDFSFDYVFEQGHDTLKLSFLLNNKRHKRSFSLLGFDAKKKSSYTFFFEGKNHLIGQMSDTYKNGKAYQCRKVDENCHSLQEDTCHLCRYGHFEVVDYNCPGGGSKFCGERRCGGEGEPACLIGYHLVHERFKQRPCVDNSPVGHCLPGLHQVCDKNNVLICL